MLSIRHKKPAPIRSGTYTSIAVAAAAAILTPAVALAAQSPATEVHHEFIMSRAAPSRRVELYWAMPHGNGPWPAVVLIHGHQEGTVTPGGKAFVGYGVLDTLTAHGYAAVALSQPGYGESDGPPDFMGPRTVGAAEDVVRWLRARSFIRADRIALEGVSRGAIVAALTAASDSTIRAIVLISGAYDFVTPPDSSTAAGRRNIARRAVVASDIAAETDGSIEALRARSALLLVSHIRTPALIINGATDDRTDPEQARALAAAIQRNGVFARVVIYPELGHAIPYATRELEIAPFLQTWLK